ncbi:hypothetical protein QBC43DRAFT_13296 [Cladorrhinum sp. PSN259]|nr:hypothetical protein QBC43DRAFT_13296 [Cladorrhinum sp. PSN259]
MALSPFFFPSSRGKKMLLLPCFLLDDAMAFLSSLGKKKGEKKGEKKSLSSRLVNWNENFNCLHHQRRTTQNLSQV